MKADSDLKANLRAQGLKRRGALAAADRDLASARIAESLLDLPEVKAGKDFFIYLARPDEAATRPIIDALCALNKHIAVPLVRTDEIMQSVRFPGWDKLEVGALNLLRPVEIEVYEPCFDVVVTPGFAFATNGARIGAGAGYYDRWFASNPHRWRIGLAFDCQIFDTVPQVEHDIALHAIITEQAIYRNPTPAAK